MTALSLNGTIISPGDRERWLAERRTGLGGSDAAAALGVSPWCSPLRLYLIKTGQAEDDAESEPMRRGRRMEAVIAQEYQDATGSTMIAEQYFVRNAAQPWLFATLDGMRDDGVIVEYKNVGMRSAREWGDEDGEQIPMHYLCQVHHQMAVTGAERCDVAALIGGQDFRVYPIASDEAMIQLLIENEAIFWDRVVRLDPPPPTVPADAKVLARLNLPVGPETELHGQDMANAMLWEAAGVQLREIEAERGVLEARLRAAMGEARAARLPDGRLLKRYRRQVEAATITRKAHTTDYLRIVQGGRDERD